MSSVRRRGSDGSQAKDGEEKKVGLMEKQYQQELARRKKKPSICRRWLSCGPVKFLAILIAIPLVLNYASLKREAKALRPKGT